MNAFPSHFLVIAHRGAFYYRPENTLAAFRHCRERGWWWVECDVRLSQDKVPVLHHDEKVYHAGRGDVLIREVNAEELKKVDVGGGEGLPTLYEILAEFGEDLAFDIELKEWESTIPVIDVISKFSIPRGVMVTSFIPEALEEAKRLAPEIPTGLIIDAITGSLVSSRNGIKAARLLHCEFFLPQSSLVKPSLVDEAHHQGLKVIPWTVNNPDQARILISWGIDGLITDRPDVIVPFPSP